MHSLIESLKESNQDFEFYPTTDEIIRRVACDIRDHYMISSNCFSILDIGAGNGKVLSGISKFFDVKPECYAIEKSPILKELIDKNFYVIGTDFHEQSLLDKNISITFCNPPYSDFSTWATRIIRESASQLIYLVIPERWKGYVDIMGALDYRQAEYKVLGEYDFLQADRQARAKVNLICIKLSGEKDDAFDRFFNSEFGHLKEKLNISDETNKEEKDSKFSSLVTGRDLVQRLVELYNADIAHIKKNYIAAGQLDADLLREFDISVDKILTLLKKRLADLKLKYWHELFSRMSEITSRLTSKKRENLFRTFNQNSHVDFTAGNIYAVVLWILKNASSYIDEQLIEVYENAISKANCKNYKSNERVFTFDRWRYNEDKPSHFFLEYRLVLTHSGGIDRDWRGRSKLSECGCETIQDLLTVANNLGFACTPSDDRLYKWEQVIVWAPGKSQEFFCTYKGNRVMLFEVKAFLNHNIHIRLNQKFALALNVEFGRLKGWLHTKEEAGNEIGDITAGEYFKSNINCLGLSSSLLLGNKNNDERLEENDNQGEICTHINSRIDSLGNTVCANKNCGVILHWGE